MRTHTGKLALIGAALIALGILGAGTVMAASPAPAKAAAGPLERIARHVVHGTVVVQKADGTLRTLQIDRGTIATIAGASVTIAEPGGAQTVATDGSTRVRKDGAKSDLSRLAVGDKVVVVSEVQGGTPVARLILVPRPRATTPPAPSVP